MKRSVLDLDDMGATFAPPSAQVFFVRLVSRYIKTEGTRAAIARNGNA